MTTFEKLLADLDLDSSASAGDALLGTTGGTATPTAHPHAVKNVDAWGERRGRELVETVPGLEGMGVDATAAADFHAAAFEPAPELVEACQDAVRHRFLGQLFDTPDFKALNATTQLNDAAAELAAVHFAQGYAALRDAEQARQDAQGDGPADPAADARQGKLAAMRAVGKALAGAKAEVDDAQAAADACGLGSGTPGATDKQRVLDLYRRVKDSDRLRKIMEQAGRFRRAAQARQRVKVNHGQDEVVGVTLGAELARLLPVEAVRLTLDETEDDTLRRLAERQLMVRDLKATEPKGKGPIVVVVDESGSMNGAKIETAKGLALAMAWVARKQRRWCALVSFAGRADGTVTLLPPTRWDESALVDWLGQFLNGGTEARVPLGEVPSRHWPEFVKAGMARGKTDMIVVTDGEVEGVHEYVDSFNAWKKAEQVRVTVLAIQNDASALAPVADETQRVNALAADGDEVGRVLSI